MTLSSPRISTRTWAVKVLGQVSCTGSFFDPSLRPDGRSDLISFLKAIPDSRDRRGMRYPLWFLLLVATRDAEPGTGLADRHISPEILMRLATARAGDAVAAAQLA
jgi:hypothetical protein